jgi:hypothetical protein
MASPVNAAAAIGVELEKVKDTVYPQFEQDDVLFTRLQARTDLLEVSDRLARIPILVYPGSQFQQFTPDGASMGPGSGEKYDDGVTTPVYFNQAVQVTSEAQWATNSKEKSVVDVYKDSFKINLRQFRSNLDALLSSSDGSGTLGTVATGGSATAGQLTVDLANNFQSQNTYSVLSAVGGTLRGTINVLTVDSVNNILYLNGTFPVGTVAGDILVVNGGSGSANTSLNGIPAINFGANTGQWFGIPRASYPGVLTTPYYNAASGPLTPQIITILESYMQRATGIDTEDLDECVASCNVDQLTAWELLGMVTTSGVATAFVDQAGGNDSRMDYMKKKRVKSIAGREVLPNLHAKKARLDLICLKYWFRVETKPAALFDVDGITVFPLYGSDGGVATACAFYYVWGGQVATERARSGAYTDTLTVPTGL